MLKGCSFRYTALPLVLGALCLLLSAGPAAADALTGNVTMNFYFPNIGTLETSPDTISVGSSIVCPGSSPICSAFGEGGDHVFAIGTDSITYTGSNDPLSNFSSATFNGWVFSGLTFSSGEPLIGFTLTTNIAGLATSDITFGPSDIEINMEGLPINGTFTLTLIPESPTATPEPSSLLLLGTGLLGLGPLIRRRFAGQSRLRR